MNKRKLLIEFFTLVLAAGVLWEIVLHTRTTVRAQGSPPDRATYVSNAYHAPFTFVASLTVSRADGTGGEFHDVETFAVNSHGDILRRVERFDPTSTTVPYSILSRMGIRESREVTYLHETPLSSTATIRKPESGFFADHAIPQKQCATPDPGVTFARYEPLSFGVAAKGQTNTAVISFRREAQPFMEGTLWRSLGLDCLEVKSAMRYEMPDGAIGITTKEPVSLNIGEPDAALFAQHKEHYSALKVEHVLPTQFEDKTRTAVVLSREHLAKMQPRTVN